jgi:WD40 repeat protein
VSLDAEDLADTAGEPWGVLGDHELFEEIGRGGMGIIYRARQRRLGRIVAVKVLRGGEFADAEARARFRAEAEAAARLQHPGIVAIHDVGEDGGVLWFSMEYLPGDNLDQRVRAQLLPAREAAECVRRVAEAVQHAHENGVFHRDLKPSNILLRDGVPCVGDFGLARRVATASSEGSAGLTRTGQVLGSPGYAAPEQALRGEADARTDVYGLGALLYHLLSGRPPFQGPTLDSILLQLREADPLPPRRLNPTVPRDLENIALHALAKNPAARYASARELGEDLARFLAGKTIRARPAGALEKAVRWSRRYPAVATLLAVLAVGTIAAFALIDRARRDEAGAKTRAEAASHAAQSANAQLAALANASELRRAEELFASGDSTQALGLLAGVLEREPAHPVAGPRLASALWSGDFAMPLLQPMFTGGYLEQLYVRDSGRALLAGTRTNPAIFDPAEGKLVRALETPREKTDLFAFSPDGRALAGWTIGRGGLVHLWDWHTGKLLFPPLGSPSRLVGFAFSADGTRFLAITSESVLRWRDMRTGEGIGPAEPSPGPILMAAVSADARLLATLETESLTLREAATFAVRHRIPWPSSAVKFRRILHFTPDARWLVASTAPEVVRFCAVEGGAPSAEIRHEDVINGCAFSADSQRLITAANDHHARIWSVPDGRPITPPLRHRDAVVFAVFSPDGTHAVTGSLDNSARLWDAATGRPLSQPLRHGEQVRAAAFSADGATLYTGGADRIVQRWDIRPRGAAAAAVPHGARVNVAEWSADGTLFATGGDDFAAHMWDAATLAPVNVQRTRAPVQGLAFAPDGRTLATVDETGVPIREARRAGERALLSAKMPGLLRCVAFSPDGTRVAIGQSDGVVTFLDAATSRTDLATAAQPGKIAAVSFSPNGRTVLTVAFSDEAGTHAGARLWDAATATPLGEPMRHDDDVNTACFSPDGALVATAGNDNRARIWDARSGAPISPPLDHERTVAAVAFSPDSRVLATASWDGTARLWDARTGALLATLQHEDRVLDVAFSPAGHRIATASRDHTVRLWDAATGLPVAEPLRHTSGVRALRFHPGGQCVLTLADDGVARVWETPDFNATPPTWLRELAGLLALRDMPREQGTPLAVLARYTAVREAALAMPPGDAFTVLAHRLFVPLEPAATEK